MNNILYFAYGSNLLQDRINFRLNTNVPVYKTYNLHGYKLVFDTGLSKRSTFANIIKGRPTDYVEGVLYQLTGEEFKELTYYEGCYNPNFFIVDNKPVAIYIGQDRYKIKGIPSLEYINTILDGCLEKGLHKTYNELVDYKLKTLKVTFSRHKKINI